MKFISKKLNKSVLEFTVTLERIELISYFGGAVDYFRNSFRTNGYRTGKTPREVVIKSIPESELRGKALNLAIQESLKKIIDSQKLKVLEFGNLKVGENDNDHLVFSVSLTLFPDINLGLYSGLKIKENPVDVSDEEVREAINELVKIKTRYKPSNGPVEKGDRAEIDFRASLNGNIIEGGKSENHPLTIGDGNFVPGFEDQLLGMRVDEEKSFTLAIPRDYYQKNIAGNSLDFTVKLKNLQKPEKITLDDNFARGLGKFKNLAELTKSIKDGLLSEKLIKENEKIKLEIVDKILEKSYVEIPRIMLEKQLDAMMTSFDKELHEKGFELGLYLAQLGKTQEELRASFKPRAEKEVKTGLLLEELGRRESITVKDREITEKFNELGAVINVQQELIRGTMTADDLKNRIQQALFKERVFDFLVRNNVEK